MTPTAHDLVQRGARLLDERLPGWADQIDLDTLDLSDECCCVIGQIGQREYNLDRIGWERPENDLIPGYWELAPLLGLAHDSDLDIEMGFMPAVEIPSAALRDAWKGEIVARRTL